MKSDRDCIFCKIVAGRVPCFKLYEDSQTLAFLDINPAAASHALIIPKEHWENVFDISAELVASVAATAKKVAQAVNQVVPSDGLNLLQCNGKGAAQSVLHFHMHVLPRHLGDELKLNWGPEPGDTQTIESLADKIRPLLAE